MSDARSIAAGLDPAPDEIPVDEWAPAAGYRCTLHSRPANDLHAAAWVLRLWRGEENLLVMATHQDMPRAREIIDEGVAIILRGQLRRGEG